MKSREDEVAGLGGSHGCGYGVDIAHFADHADVDILTEHRGQSIGEVRRIYAHFPLVDDGFL